MKIAFLVVGILLIVLFLGWLFLVRPGKDRKWMAFILDAALIMVSAVVLTMGFMMRSRHIADSAAAKTAQEDGGAGDAGEDDGQPVEGVTPQRLQEGETQTTEGSEGVENQGSEDIQNQGSGETESSSESQGTEGGQGAEREPGGQEAGGTESGDSQEPEGAQGSQKPEGSQESQEPASTQDSEQESSSQGREESQESGEGSQDLSNPDEEETSSESEYIE